MRPLLAAGLIGVIVAVVVTLAVSEYGPDLARPAAARPADVPAGDIEFAWINTTTNGVSWERFVAGLARLPTLLPGVIVDDSRAFVESTSASPEVVIYKPGDPGRLRVRWYKITTEAGVSRWVRALSKRSPAPVAFIGGGSTDRAVELALALEATPVWRGPRPLLFITTATADQYTVGSNGLERADLLKAYDGRTFRFCFTNSRIAESVVDFIWQTPDLKPTTPPDAPPLVLSVTWTDDPFSEDLHTQFADALTQKGAAVTQLQVPFSVGRMHTANDGEALAGRGVREQVARQPGRTLLMLPTVTNPARRLVREILMPQPELASRLVVATGDGIPVNALWRDASFAWPGRELPVPLVVFCHNDPTDWTDPGPPGYRVEKPNATEEVRHFAEMGRAMTEAAFATDPRPDTPRMRDNLQSLKPRLFGPDGERAIGTGEYVAVLRPASESATITAYRRDESGWKRVRETVFGYREAE